MNHPAPVQLSLMPALAAMPLPRVAPVRPTPSVGQAEAAAADLQGLLTELFLQEEPAQCLLAVTGLVPEAHRSAWHLVTHTLLARRLALGSPAHLQHAADAHTLAWGLARQWDQPVLMQRWQRLLNRLTLRQCQRLATRLRRQLRAARALH